MESTIKQGNNKEMPASSSNTDKTTYNKKIKLEEESSKCSTQNKNSKISKLGQKYILRHKIQLKSEDTANDVQSRTSKSVTNVQYKNEAQLKTNKNSNVIDTTASECPSQDDNNLYDTELMPTKTLNFSSSIYDRRVKVKLVNLLLNTHEAVPVEEETKFKSIYHYVNGPVKMHALEIVFRDYVHMRILTKNYSWQEEILCRCKRYEDWGCTGSVLINYDKVVRFRDHFCKGRDDKRFTDLDLTDFSILVFYFNAELGCQEVLYNGFMYWKEAQEEEGPNDFEWVCTAKPRCKARLKILPQQTAAVVGKHVCLLPYKKSASSRKTVPVPKKETKKVTNNNMAGNRVNFKKQYVMIKKTVEC